MNIEEETLLNELLAQDPLSLTDEDKSHLSHLIEKHGYAFAAKAVATETPAEEALNSDEVKNLVISALSQVGLDSATVTKIKSSLNESKSGITFSDVETAVAKAVSDAQSEQKNLLTEMTKSFFAQNQAANTQISKDQLDSTLKTFAENIKSPSRHEFSEQGDSTFPIEHRTGNLTVGQKQLLNLCLMNVTEDALSQGKSVRPTSMDEGITKAQLSAAEINGERYARNVRKSVVYGRKANMTSVDTGLGVELVNTTLSSDLLSRLYLESVLSAEFAGQEIVMPTNPFLLPLTTTRPTFTIGAQPVDTTVSSTTVGTANTTLTAAKLIGQIGYSYESDEDSIIAILPMLQEQLGAAAAEALENAMVNGDTASTHQDTDTTGSNAAKAFDGFRKYSLANSKALSVDLSAGGITAMNIGAMRKAMGKYGVRTQDLILVTGVKGYNDIVQLDETLTADKVNGAARILTGNAPSLFGIRVITSSAVREDLNSNGVYASGSELGSIFIVHKPSFLLGVRRGFTVEVHQDKQTQLNYVIASFRRAFMPKETPTTTVSSVVMGYNYSVD